LQQQISTTINPTTIIGREEELATISRFHESERSEFLAIHTAFRGLNLVTSKSVLTAPTAFVSVGTISNRWAMFRMGSLLALSKFGRIESVKVGKNGVIMILL